MGFRARHSRMYYLACRLFQVGDNLDPIDSRRAFYSPLTVLKNLDRGLVPGRETLPEYIYFLYQKGLSAGHGKHFFIKHWPLPSSCDLSPLWSPRLPPPPSWFRMANKSFICMTVRLCLISLGFPHI